LFNSYHITGNYYLLLIKCDHFILESKQNSIRPTHPHQKPIMFLCCNTLYYRIWEIGKSK